MKNKGFLKLKGAKFLEFVKWVQKRINSQKKGARLTVAELFPEVWRKYDASSEVTSRKNIGQKKRNFGHAFGRAVKNEEYNGIERVGRKSNNSALYEMK